MCKMLASRYSRSVSERGNEWVIVGDISKSVSEGKGDL